MSWDEEKFKDVEKQIQILMKASAMKTKASAAEIVQDVLGAIRKFNPTVSVNLSSTDRAELERYVIVKLLELVDFTNERIGSMTSLIEQARKKDEGIAK